MRSQLKLSPKTKTTVSVKSTIVYASVGVSIFILIFTGAFFYLNMGNNEEIIAAPSTIIANPGGGAWEDPATWSLGRVPAGNDVIEIPVGEIVTIAQNPKITLNNVEIKVFGTLEISGSLFLDEQSKIMIGDGGEIKATGPGNGNNERLSIGGYVLQGNDFEAEIPSPGSLTSAGPSQETLLPIVLDYFTAEVTATNSVLVEWGTVSEKENDFFTLERSSDGKTFETITTIEGAGNSNQKLQYSFEDNKSSVGMNYYRLKQTDYNGDFEYFKIVGVNNTVGSSTISEESTIETIKISKAYPNPFKSEVNLTFDAEMDGDVEVMIQNARGEIVHKEIISFYYGHNEYKFTKGDQLQAGVYYINLWSNGKKFKPQRLIKM